MALEQQKKHFKTLKRGTNSSHDLCLFLRPFKKIMIKKIINFSDYFLFMDAISVMVNLLQPPHP